MRLRRDAIEAVEAAYEKLLRGTAVFLAALVFSVVVNQPWRLTIVKANIAGLLDRFVIAQLDAPDLD